MIRIGKPFIIEKNGQTSLISHIADESQSIDSDIYYTVNSEYGEFLTEEVADTYVVGCLLPAVLHNEDIIVEGNMSEKLYYNIKNSVLHILSIIYGNKINLHASNLIRTQYNGNGVGCGCSLGVDSLSAIFQHFPSLCGDKEKVASKSYQITHLTYFNVGAMGYVDLEKAKKAYEKDLRLINSFANEIELPVLCLESNFSILYKDFDFDASGDIRNFSACLSLQKLFGKYLYGSSFPIADFKFDKGQTGYYETLLAPLLSTESMEIIIANPDMTRIDKTKFIVDNPLTQKYLYVCWKELIANRWPDSEIAKIKDKKLNCSRCDKCKRTLLALDVMGKLSLFENIFDIPYWESAKDKYIARVIFKKDDNSFYKDLYNLMKEENYPISSQAKMELRRLQIQNTYIWKLYYQIKKTIKKRLNQY